jgi:hypothetical protein
MVDLTHTRAGNRIDTGHNSTEIFVGPITDGKRGYVPRIFGNVLGVGATKPTVIGGSAFEIASSPDAMREMQRPLAIGYGVPAFGSDESGRGCQPN